MKKFISIISTLTAILAVTIFMNSCRQHSDYDSVLPMKAKNEKGIENRKAGDTLQQLSNQIEFVEIEPKDPPPKNGGQWKSNH